MGIIREDLIKWTKALAVQFQVHSSRGKSLGAFDWYTQIAARLYDNSRLFLQLTATQKFLPLSGVRYTSLAKSDICKFRKPVKKRTNKPALQIYDIHPKREFNTRLEKTERAPLNNWRGGGGHQRVNFIDWIMLASVIATLSSEMA